VISKLPPNVPLLGRNKKHFPMSKGLIWLMFHPLGRNKKHFPMSKGLIWLMFHPLQVRQGPMEN
jgi:hypothetical protein